MQGKDEFAECNLWLTDQKAKLSLWSNLLKRLLDI